MRDDDDDEFEDDDEEEKQLLDDEVQADDDDEGQSESDDDGPLRLPAGPIPMRDAVRSLLFTLRHFSQLRVRDQARKLPAARLGAESIGDVEDALRCVLPYEILACMANQDDVLSEEGFSLGDVVELTRQSRELARLKDMIAVGEDSHLMYCVPRRGNREGPARLYEFEGEDQSLQSYDLAEWLGRQIELRREFLSEDHPELKDWKPSPEELAAFKPAIIAGWA